MVVRYGRGKPFFGQNYLGPDASLETGYSPTYRNRFRTTWAGTPVTLLRDETDGLHYGEKGRRKVSTPGANDHLATVTPDFQRALDDVLECVPHLRQYRDDLSPR